MSGLVEKNKTIFKAEGFKRLLHLGQWVEKNMQPCGWAAFMWTGATIQDT